MEEKDIQQGFEKLSEMLSTEDGQKQISDIISALQGDGDGEESPLSGILSSFGMGEEKKEEKTTQNSGFDLDFATLSKIKKLLSASGGKKSESTVLLQSLKPFLRDERKEKIDNLIKIMSYASVFKEFGGFMKGGD